MSRNHGRKPPKPADLAPVMDAGRAYYKRDPDALLASVMRKAAAQYASEHDQLAFLEGYSQARQQHEQFLRERDHGV